MPRDFGTAESEKSGGILYGFPAFFSCTDGAKDPAFSRRRLIQRFLKKSPVSFRKGKETGLLHCIKTLRYHSFCRLGRPLTAILQSPPAVSVGLRPSYLPQLWDRPLRGQYTACPSPPRTNRRFSAIGREAAFSSSMRFPDIGKIITPKLPGVKHRNTKVFPWRL